MWWHACMIIFSIGSSVFISVGGIITILNYQTDKDWLDNRLKSKQLELKLLETKRAIARDKYEHDQKMIGA